MKENIKHPREPRVLSWEMIEGDMGTPEIIQRRQAERERDEREIVRVLCGGGFRVIKKQIGAE